MSPNELPSAPRRAVHPLTWLLDVVGSIWFGVVLLVLIFLYASIGSAVAPIRQGALADLLGLDFLRFEKSEMEWFSWWPFVTLIVVFCISMMVATIRRIPLTLANAGVWAIHGGIALMAGACVYYFGSKVEGDTVIFQSLARIRVAGGPETTMVVCPDASASAGQGSKQYRIQVTRLEPDFFPPSGPNKGHRMPRIWMNVTCVDPPRSFIRRMVVGDPAATEDLMPDTRQRTTLDPDLQIVLDYDPARYFYHSHEMPVHSNGAIYARLSPADDWTQLRIKWLPHYYEWVSHRTELWPTPGEPLPPTRQLDEPLQKPEGVAWLDGLEMRVTDYLPYGQMEARYVEGGQSDPLNPVLRLRLGRNDPQELAAFDPHQNRLALMQGLSIQFTWASDPQQRAALIKRPDPRIKVRVPSKNLERELKLQALEGAGPVAVEGTDYTVELRQVLGAGQMAAHSTAMAVVRIAKGDKSFDRVVMAGDPGGGRDLDRLMQEDAMADPEILLEYLDPARSGLLLVAGPDPDSDLIDAVLTQGAGYKHQQARIGEPLHVFPAVPLAIESLLRHARQEVRPMILPRAQRSSLGFQGKRASLVRVEINDGHRIQSVWLTFNEYPFPDAQRAQPNRFNYAPRTVQLADGRRLQLMYSRQREPLPSPVALDRFVLQTYPGGDRESDFISRVSFQKEDGSWSRLTEIRSNQPARHGDYWYFQSRWDPGTESHTVLGVGNRKGVHAMLAGVCISIAGMIYAFYVKPVIRRRRATRGTSGTPERQPLAVAPGGSGDSALIAREQSSAASLG